MTSLTDFIQSFDASKVSHESRIHVVDAMTDCVGCAMAGAAEPILAPLLAVYGTQDSGGVPVIGTGRFAAPADSAVLNGALSHAIDYDDISHPAYGHPTVVLLPALLALTQLSGASGPELVDAYIVGLQVFGKLGRALNMDHSERGWHPTATFGTMAAAAAACRLLRLDAAQIESAIGLAVSSAAGVRMNFGTMAKPLHAGYAARNGVLAAQLAASGLTATAGGVTHKYGFARVFNTDGTVRWDELQDWARPLEIETEYGLCLKPYPACSGAHTAIEAVLDLRHALGGDISQVRTVRVGASRLAFLALTYDNPATALQGKFSMPYCVAQALVKGDVNLETFSETALHDSQVRSWLPKIRVEDDVRVRDHPEMGAVVSLEMSDGSVRERMVLIASGKPERWFSHDRLRSKFMECAGLRTGPAQAAAIFAEMQALDESGRPLEKLMRLLGEAPTPAA